ncbi:MAG: hypothetical protein Q9218_005866 [Villophora microphyllina]
MSYTMETLTDITSKVANKNMRSGTSPLHLLANAPSQSKGKHEANFMSPTMASTKRANESSNSPVPTPASSIKPEKATTGKWMTSAARRVGLRRTGGDGTPRSKKEGLKVPQNAVAFPDKLSASSHVNMPSSPRPSPTSASSFNNKPLPSPPIARVTTGILEEPRSLIDASEKPLLRSSPKSTQQGEEWPVLFPQKVTPSGTSTESSHQELAKATRVISNDQERYPLLRGSGSANAHLDQKPVSKVTSSQNFQRKQVSTASLRDHHTFHASTEPRGKDTVSHAAEPKNARAKAAPDNTKATHRLSAGAAAVEKASADSNSIKEPRQTRTSSLRARISAGQVIRDSPNKVLGFTDFTVEKLPSPKTNNEDLVSGASFRARGSNSLNNPFTKKPSKESLHGNRAPAQFVAGSRRPVARRPSSRGSLRNESRASSPAFLEPARPAPPVPDAKNDMSPRKSSIPVLQSSTTTNINRADPKDSSIKLAETLSNFNNVSESFADHSFQPLKPEGAARSSSGPDTVKVLESIEESPTSTFRTKRISSKSPTFGPTLKVSSSAHRLIMGGNEASKENQPLARKKSKDLLRAAVTGEKRTVTQSKTASASKDTRRPLSSQGFPENRSLPDSPTKTPRAKKVKSADLSSISPSHKVKTEDASNDNVHNHTEEGQVLVGQLGRNQAASAAQMPKAGVELEKAAATSEAFFHANPKLSVSPVKDSATPISDAMPVIPALLPESMQEHVKKAEHASYVAREDEVKLRNNGHDAPSTPPQKLENGGTKSSPEFPPRSSSRTKHPDYTVNGSAKSSPTSSFERAASRLQKEITASQAAEPKNSDAGDFFPPLTIMASHRGMSSQTILADPSKRDSTAQHSTRSQSSLSKGLKSSFRGLFHHKRSSDNINASRSSKKPAKRPTVTATGSPSLLDIHPVYRPTASSINRAKSPAQRSSNHSTHLLNASANASANANAPETPAFASPKPSEISTTTALAMEILESARKEHSSPKRKRLVGMAEVLVNVIAQARNAEKAFEEAKRAAREAEVAHARCKTGVSDIAHMVKEWKGDE